jgi:hypothetical protein
MGKPEMVTLTDITMKRGLTFVLIAQAVIAGLLILSDIDARWLPSWRDSDALPTGPVTPGDQVRRFDPIRTQPGYTGPGTLPEMDLPEEMIERLDFAVTEIGEFGEHLLVLGAIEPGDAKRFEAFLESQKDPTLPVAFHSPGGAVKEALAIGRMLRERDMTTVILPGMACVSACPYMLAGGVERKVSRDGAVGLHQHYYDAPGYLPAIWAVEQIQFGQGETMAFLIEMDVDPALMLYSLNTPPDDIYVLIEEELLDSRIATELTD